MQAWKMTNHIVVLLVLSSFVYSEGQSRWDIGEYSVPMSIFGCAYPTSKNWLLGYMNITFKQEIDLFESSLGRIGWNGTDLTLLELQGPYGHHSIQLNFCTSSKVRNNTNIEWPRGRYGIYGSRAGCPSGFTESVMNKSVPEILFVNTDGYLPDIQINTEGNSSIISFLTCQRVPENTNAFNAEPKNAFDPQQYDVNYPFIVLTPDDEEGHLNLSSEYDVILRRVFLLSTDSNRIRSKYSWINHYSLIIKDKALTAEDPEFIDRIRQNSTVLIPSDATYSIGGRFEYTYVDLFMDNPKQTDTTVWVLYDIGISAVISGSCLWYGDDTQRLGVDQRNALIPYVYVGEMKWSFMSNGSPRCIPETYTNSAFYQSNSDSYSWILIQCMNKPVGRYIFMVFPKPTDETRMDLLHIFWQFKFVQFITSEVSPRCNRPLGMRGGAILDLQITASSALPEHQPYQARPHHEGWCAAVDDPKPYLQIDFMARVRVEGIQIFMERLLDFLYGRDAGYYYTFSVLVGTELSDLHWLRQEFHMNLFLSERNAQKIMFASSIKLRYLRVYPHKQIGDNAIICVNIEVIGCQIPDPFSRICNGSREWCSTRNLYISHRQSEPVHKLFINSPNDCLSRCHNMWQCYAIQYHHDTGECEIYTQSFTHSYRYLSLKSNQTEAFIGICDTDEYFVASSGYLSSIRQVKLEESTSINPSIITSAGYPLFYPSESSSIWTVFFGEQNYVNLLFSDISLNVYTDSASAESHSECEDTIYLYPFHSTAPIMINVISRYLESDKVEKSPLKDDQREAVLTKSMNNQQLSYKVDRNVITIVLRSCAENNIIAQHGRGFRMLAYGSETPLCFRQTGYGLGLGYGPPLPCEQKKAEIFSPSFLGWMYDESEYSSWHLKGDFGEEVILQITDFDIGCETGSDLEISDGNRLVHYCNKNRPVYPIYGLYEIDIQFHINLCGSRILVEGFRGNYSVVESKSQTFKSMTSLYEEDTTLVPLYRIKVMPNVSFEHIGKDNRDKPCSEELHKCFTMLDLRLLTTRVFTDLPDISWNTFKSRICEDNNMSIAAIHSKQEQDFVSFYLQHGFQRHSKIYTISSDEHYGYAYIGLRRNVNKFSWSDGSPVTYTAWDVGQPSRNAYSDCTRVNIKTRSTDKIWESIPCVTTEAEFGVCEYSLTTRNISNETIQNGLMSESVLEPLPVTEQSLYFPCGDGEMISVLGKCDGKRDCISGLDEEGCNTSGSCLMDQFRCSDGKCVVISVLCDFHVDCIDREDEDCDFVDCSSAEFKCDSNHCIDGGFRCDGKPDCLLGEDELQCSSCNPSTAFNCGDYTCIPLAYRCDGVPDCKSTEDERNCVEPTTCQEWWNAGYRENGMYKIYGEDMECDFSEISTTGILITKYHNIDYMDGDRKRGYGFSNVNIYPQYGSESALKALHSSNICYQSVDQLCQPWIQEIYDTDKNNSTPLTSRCRCLRWIHDFTINNGHFEDCDGGPITDPDSAVEFKQSLNNPYMDKPSLNNPYMDRLRFTDEYRLNKQEPKSDIRIRFNPVVCSTEFIPTPLDFVCGNGITVPNATRCLYRMTAFGTMFGCRSFAHLQNCDTWLSNTETETVYQTVKRDRIQNSDHCGAFETINISKCVKRLKYKPYSSNSELCRSFQCPVGYFKCPGSFCLESRFVCDGEKHCEAGEDEQNCGTPEQICVSQYRCLQSNVCLSLDNLCDGTRQCPLGDDERFCDFRCPHGCICDGMAADCRMADVYAENATILSKNTKLIDMSTNPSFSSFFMQNNKHLLYLSFLNMSICGVSEILNDSFIFMTNLLVLDMSYNSIRVFPSDLFARQHRLKMLLLIGNIDIHVIEPRAFNGLLSVSYFELTNAHIGHLSTDAFQSLSLETLDLSQNTIELIDNQAFQGSTVANLYLNTTNIKFFDQDIFYDLNITNSLVTNAYKFCCIRPSDLSEKDCYPHKDEFSSCSDLMRNDALRALLWVIGTFSLLGNAASLVYRFFFDRERLKLGYGIFVSNLAVADFLMGVYLITIALADVSFRGTYILNDESWRRSAWCTMAGVLSTVSSEASVLFICLITVDRILVIKFPFGQVRFKTRSSSACACIIWIVATLIAVLPLLITSYFKDTFYSKSGVCLAIPLTRDRPPGWIYSIGIFIGFNFFTCLAVATGQWIIYRTLDRSRSKVKSLSTARSNDLRVARNLLLVVATDFLCWFPIGILGILALTNQVIPGDVYAWTAVLVLPINSALNPFLYTLSAILGRGKFTPDKNEQARPKVLLDFEVWNRSTFIPPSFSKHLQPLPFYLKKKTVNCKNCLLTAATVARSLVYLHERGLSHTKLSIKEIYMKPTVKNSFSVVMSFHPRLAENENEKQKDIAEFGNILNDLLKKCHTSSSKPGRFRPRKI